MRFADIAPPLHEEEEEAGHAHCAVAAAAEDVKNEGGEEEASRPGSAAGLRSAATTIEDVRALRVKLETLLRESGLKIDLNLEIV